MGTLQKGRQTTQTIANYGIVKPNGGASTQYREGVNVEKGKTKSKSGITYQSPENFYNEVLSSNPSLNTSVEKTASQPTKPSQTSGITIKTPTEFFNDPAKKEQSHSLQGYTPNEAELKHQFKNNQSIRDFLSNYQANLNAGNPISAAEQAKLAFVKEQLNTQAQTTHPTRWRNIAFLSITVAAASAIAGVFFPPAFAITGVSLLGFIASATKASHDKKLEKETQSLLQQSETLTTQAGRSTVSTSSNDNRVINTHTSSHASILSALHNNGNNANADPVVHINSNQDPNQKGILKNNKSDSKPTQEKKKVRFGEKEILVFREGPQDPSQTTYDKYVHVEQIGDEHNNDNPAEYSGGIKPSGL
ncbi:MAG: hypothetical protein Tsb005_04010 [Gammaproteobacteria bacterium]